jgi:hypothetical protein
MPSRASADKWGVLTLGTPVWFGIIPGKVIPHDQNDIRLLRAFLIILSNGLACHQQIHHYNQEGKGQLHIAKLFKAL